MHHEDETTAPSGGGGGEGSGATPWQMAAWACYDWANSAFAAVIQTFVFANYFTRQIAPSETEGQSQWALTIGAAGALIGLSGPVLGAVADQAGRRKPWIASLTGLGVAATAAMWFIKPDAPVWPALLLVAMGTIGVETAIIFYNAMLADLVPTDRVGRWSGWGWGAGYAGGLVCLTVGLTVFIGLGGLGAGAGKEASEVRVTFLLTAAWLGVFALPLLLITPDAAGAARPLGPAIRGGCRQLLETARQIRRYGPIVRFLIARLFYIDGLASIFALGGAYASGVFDLDTQAIILFGIGLNVTAGVGAFGLAWVDDWIGAKWTIAFSLIGIMIPGLLMLAVESRAALWACGLTLGLFVGPVQASSRSYLARAAPRHLRTQAFGLYAFSGKATAFAGPLLVWTVTSWTGSQRWGMMPIFGFLALGLAILLTLPRASHAVEPAEPERG
jgi:UMF1 family MFS transporter